MGKETHFGTACEAPICSYYMEKHKEKDAGHQYSNSEHVCQVSRSEGVRLLVLRIVHLVVPLGDGHVE